MTFAFSPRVLPYLLVTMSLWLVWLVGTLTQTPFRSLGVLLFDLMGSFILIQLSGKLPKTLRLSVWGLGLALVLITLGDANLTYSLFVGIARTTMLGWREPFYYAGSLLVAVSALAFPFAMQRQGLYPRTQAFTLVLSSLGVAVLLTAVIALVSRTIISQTIYLFVSSFLTTLFAAQTIALGSGRLSVTLRQLSMVFVLVSLARLAAIVLTGQLIGEIVYDVLWCAGLSIAAWMTATRA